MHNVSSESFEVVPVQAFAPKPMNETQLVLKRALERMDGGKKWCQTAARDGELRCTYGALWDVSVDEQRDKALAALKKASWELSKQYPSHLNDRAKSFSEVERMFLRAIALAQ